MVTVDLVGPMPLSARGNTWILVLTKNLPGGGRLGYSKRVSFQQWFDPELTYVLLVPVLANE